MPTLLGSIFAGGSVTCSDAKVLAIFRIVVKALVFERRIYVRVGKSGGKCGRCGNCYGYGPELIRLVVNIDLETGSRRMRSERRMLFLYGHRQED